MLDTWTLGHLDNLAHVVRSRGGPVDCVALALGLHLEEVVVVVVVVVVVMVIFLI